MAPEGMQHNPSEEHRGPSAAARQKAFEHKASFEEGMESLNTKIQDKQREIQARTEELEKGRARKGELTDENLIKLADAVEEVTLMAIAKLEQEKRSLVEELEGRKRSLQ
ncbi:MAG: hypothetical protein WC217_02705 [Candidatus Paceibacterota bacterium]